MEFFNPVQKVGWTAGQPLIQVKNEGGVNQQFDFTPLANQLANQQAAASNFHNIVGAAQFPIGSFAGAQAGQAERVGFPKQAVATVKQNGKLKGGAKTVDNKKDKNSTRKWSPNRKAAGFWSPFNDWWRLEFERLGRRPTTEEVSAWYVDHADRVWRDAKPSVKETRRHAKCLRTTEDVRNYFRKYRAKKGFVQAKKNEAAAAKAKIKRNSLVRLKSTVEKAQLASTFKSSVFEALNKPLNAILQEQPKAIEATPKFPQAWIQPPGGNGLLNAAGNLGTFASQNDMFSAMSMYRNYAAQATQAAPFAFVQNQNLLYQNAIGRTLARDVQQYAKFPAQKQHSTNSTETTELVNEAACLSNMISHIERSRTPTPIPWRHEEVSTFFDGEMDMGDEYKL